MLLKLSLKQEIYVYIYSYIYVYSIVWSWWDLHSLSKDKTPSIFEMTVINSEKKIPFLTVNYHPKTTNLRQRMTCFDLFFSLNIPETKILRYFSNGMYKLNQTKNCFYFHGPLEPIPNFTERAATPCLCLSPCPNLLKKNINSTISSFLAPNAVKISRN